MRGAMDSMDVMQSVHRSLLVGLRNERFEVKSPQQLVGLAVVMVQRKVARHWRRMKRTLPLDGRLAYHATPLDQVAGLEPPPAEVAGANDLLEQFLLQLDEIDRPLVRLKLDGYNSVDAGAVLGREPGFVRMRWARLRQLLRRRGGVNEQP
jgi:RNA polymerase sigma-70 factor (ECF subfamily)